VSLPDRHHLWGRGFRRGRVAQRSVQLRTSGCGLVRRHRHVTAGCTKRHRIHAAAQYPDSTHHRCSVCVLAFPMSASVVNRPIRLPTSTQKTSAGAFLILHGTTIQPYRGSKVRYSTTLCKRRHCGAVQLLQGVNHNSSAQPRIRGKHILRLSRCASLLITLVTSCSEQVLHRANHEVGGLRERSIPGPAVSGHVSTEVRHRRAWRASAA